MGHWTEEAQSSASAEGGEGAAGEASASCPHERLGSSIESDAAELWDSEIDTSEARSGGDAPAADEPREDAA